MLVYLIPKIKEVIEALHINMLIIISKSQKNHRIITSITYQNYLSKKYDVICKTLFSQLTGTTLLVLLNLVQLIIQLVDYNSEASDSPTSPMVASAVLALTFAIAGACGYVNKKMGVISSGFLFIFWFLVSILKNTEEDLKLCILCIPKILKIQKSMDPKAHKRSF